MSSQQAAQVVQEARETFPELFAGKSDREIINRIAEAEKKYAHLTFEEKYALLTPENKKLLDDRIAKLVEQQTREEARHENQV